MLVLVNPCSGPGRALSIFQERVVPVFAESGIHFNLLVTGKWTLCMSRKCSSSNQNADLRWDGDRNFGAVFNNLTFRRSLLTVSHITGTRSPEQSPRCQRFSCISEYAGHARKVVKNITRSQWYGIVIVSGDGLVYEVLLHLRPSCCLSLDWRKIKCPKKVRASHSLSVIRLVWRHES